MNDCRQYHTDKKSGPARIIHMSQNLRPRLHFCQWNGEPAEACDAKKDDAETEEAYADLPERIFTEEDKHKASDKKHPNEHIHLYG